MGLLHMLMKMQISTWAKGGGLGGVGELTGK